jgi:OmpA-OmpF porin, OOP family
MAIVDSIMNLLTRQTMSSLADRLGATPSAVQVGIGASVAALLAGIANRAGDSGFMGQVFNLLKSADTHNIVNTLPHLASGEGASSPVTEQGVKLSSLLLRNQQALIENLIGRQSGLSADAGHELMSFAAPLTAAFLGHQIRKIGFTSSSFAGMIRSEAPKIQNFVPAGVANLLSPVPVPSALGSAKATATEGGGSRVFFALISLLLLGLVAWFVSHGCNKSEPVPAAPAAAVTPAPAAAASTAPIPVAGPLGEFINRKLPDDTELNIPRLGIENKLLDFIQDNSRPVDKTTWFDFDRLTFDTGKATLQVSSAEQLQNIAAILKAYPNVKVKIGSYTDNTGNKEANLRLSQARATDVMHELVQRGVDRSQLDAEGYGEQHPVADNATPEGRQKNRRISLRVTEK